MTLSDGGRVAHVAREGPNVIQRTGECRQRLTKMVHLAACNDTSTAEEVAKLFFDKVVVAHGVPCNIVSDRDSRFTSNFWKALMNYMGVGIHMSSAFHPESDGNTERVNRVMEDMLRHVVASEHNSWHNYLGLVEFAINNAHHESIQATPFMLNYGRHPHTPVSSLIRRDAERAANKLKYAAKALESAPKVPAAQEFVDRMNRLLELSKVCLGRCPAATEGLR